MREGERPSMLDRPRCAHPDAIPVEAGGEVVAGLCPACDVQLSAEWFACPHASAETVEWDEDHPLGQGGSAFSKMYPGHLHCQSCGSAWWQPIERIPAMWLQAPARLTDTT